MQMCEKRKVRKNSNSRTLRSDAKREKREGICRSSSKALPATNGRGRKEEKEGKKRSKILFSVTHDSRGEVEHIWYRLTCFE
jgi:hypothetical protein